VKRTTMRRARRKVDGCLPSRNRLRKRNNSLILRPP
jgi:hypothetical protein